MDLICYGDSLTFGFGASPTTRWTRLTEQISGWRVINRGINGDTTSGILTRIQEVERPYAGAPASERPSVLVMGGSNDIFYSGSDAAARANLGAAAHQLLGMGVRPLIGVPLPIMPALVPESWAKAVDFSSAEHILSLYCQWILSFCHAFGVACVDFRSDFLYPDGGVRADLLMDGLHPAPAGHQIMAKRLASVLCRFQ